MPTRAREKGEKRENMYTEISMQKKDRRITAAYVCMAVIIPVLSLILPLSLSAVQIPLSILLHGINSDRKGLIIQHAELSPHRIKFRIAGSLRKLHIYGKLPFQLDVSHIVKGFNLTSAMRTHRLSIINLHVGTHDGPIISNAEGGKVLRGIITKAGNQTAQQCTAKEHLTDQKTGTNLPRGV